ncbi:MAG: hypothetical protein J5879_02155 [Clostridia bacterium]|nr:hypothetical protein [Clostridia bacterium]
MKRLCFRCGAEVPAAEEKCPVCGRKYRDNFITRTKDLSDRFDPAETGGNKLLCVLSYLGVLVLIPLLSVKSTDYVKFHAKQGLILTVATTLYVVVMNVVSYLVRAAYGNYVFVFLGLGLYAVLFYLLFLSVLGIIYAVRGRAKLLPGMSVFFHADAEE